MVCSHSTSQTVRLSASASKIPSFCCIDYEHWLYTLLLGRELRCGSVQTRKRVLNDSTKLSVIVLFIYDLISPNKKGGSKEIDRWYERSRYIFTASVSDYNIYSV